MVVDFSAGKVIVTPHEIVIKVSSEHMITLQAQADAIQLIGRGANVIAAHGAENKWSIKLDDAQQLALIAEQIGVKVQ
ncbi:DUF3389 domain-containing protein [Vibrio pectenicida]|uniref:DUF3389 domain-containing protein n=1 Tax=Vibrio pectenicida TaxID=62763 RepID=A0A427U118_9VIBR|nr:DUF3389 domain-containing protein [Vibrio pectenicida]NOH72949.1 DUF3389 domain-containing protein [Vibrio pectenicida]RSD30354.1 DUF3389 domain-containing protein [Vibrio pectenicida]